MSSMLAAKCQAEAACRAFGDAVVREPCFAKDPRGAYRRHRVPEIPIKKFMEGMRRPELGEAVI
jgi:hypothetical protein